VAKAAGMEAVGVSLALNVVLVLGVMLTVTLVDPLKTPTTLTLEVSLIFNNAQRLLMKLVSTPALLKKSLISIAKWVVSWTD
jgi:predicted phosphoribosyltransferase